MSREALVLLVCCCDFRDGAEWLIPSKSLRNAVIRAFPGLLCILRMCAPRRAAAVVRPRGREKSADRRRRILISRLLIIRASVPRRKSPFPAYFKGFPAVSPLIPPYPAFLKYPVSPQQLLDEALIRTYAKKGITHNNESLIDPEHPDRYREMPLLGDIYEILMESPETRRMGNILNRLVNGSAKTFNQHTNVQLDNLYTVLDISELTGELLPVGMFVALDYVWDKAKEDRTKEKAIFIDEAWELIGDDDTNNPNNTKALAGEWVQEIFKIIRGYGGAAIAATQDIGDLDRSRFGKGILNGAKTKIILNLENDEAQRVQHILHLSDAEIMSITRFERGQGLISTNSNHITVSFKASPLEKQLITTDRMELNQILKEKIAQNTHNVVE